MIYSWPLLKVFSIYIEREMARGRGLGHLAGWDENTPVAEIGTRTRPPAWRGATLDSSFLACLLADIGQVYVRCLVDFTLA